MKENELRPIYEAVAPDLYAYIERVCGNVSDAEDIFQETFARLFGSEFSAGDGSESRRYLFRIATNLMRDRHRWTRRWKFGALPERTGRDPESGYLEQIDVGRAMADLKPKQRALLWLAYVDGLPHKEIAEILGVASTSVRVLLSRARKSMISKMKEESP